MTSMAGAFRLGSEPYGPQVFVAIAEYLKTLDAPATLRWTGRWALKRSRCPRRCGSGWRFPRRERCAQSQRAMGSDGRAYRPGAPGGLDRARATRWWTCRSRHHGRAPLQELGRLLFWDTRLSGNGSTACVSCHAPSAGWGESDAVSRGYPGTRHWRNSQTILKPPHYQRRLGTAPPPA
ncbi:MAG: cytochrome-c peroxidase [Rhodoferax sp.]|nr:cytochrome-c peroxidase [Rhodoferax sp.]